MEAVVTNRPLNWPDSLTTSCRRYETLRERPIQTPDFTAIPGVFSSPAYDANANGLRAVAKIVEFKQAMDIRVFPEFELGVEFRLEGVIVLGIHDRRAAGIASLASRNREDEDCPSSGQQ